MTGCREVPGGRSEASSCPCRHFAAESLGGNDLEADRSHSILRQQHGIVTRASVRRNRGQRDSSVLSLCHRARQPAMPRRAKPNGLNISIRGTWPKTLELVCASAEWRKITLCTRAIAAGRTSRLICHDAGRCIRARRPMFEEKATNPKVGGLVWSFQLVSLVSSRRLPTDAPCAAAARRSPGRSCC